MAKQLNVNLAFNADTSKVKAQLQELQNHLNNLTNTTAAQLPITKEVQEAQQATIHLKTALQQAVNVNTGKFDLSKFNQSIKTSGTSLEQIRNRLVQIGPSGQQAFASLAQSIASAEIPARRTSALLSELGTTLKNTVKWQFSSSMLHGFMGAIQSAYGYAQDLNKSLNDIRIVTGLSADEMDKFAIKANKAAKALSASTLEYTNAALIYYQQGLDSKAVEERTNVTIKMANVTGEVASDVSNYMTAVWNNFAKGGETLEYYADVMTALGAATASSTDEIAAGLEKFASVADTVGLSYEYATAALATVTATTRQSADVVGTAFKTLFARIQDLELGETLDDGTTLGSYSQALQKVGINIKDTSGQLKDMDIILEEMAAKWETLGKAERTALAQSVAGVRQYTQLIALMDNWDFMESNLGVANSAEGTLQEQADIYAESWEGARDRVKAAAEAIYSDLLNDDFFIDLTNGLEKILTLFDHFLDAIGGAKGLIFGLSSILLNTFSAQAAKGLENMVYNLKSFVGLTQKEAIATKMEANRLMAEKVPSSGPSVLNTFTSDASTTGMQTQFELTSQVAMLKEKMTEHQQMEAQAILNQNKAYADQLVVLGQKADALKSEKESAKTNLLDDAAFELGTVRAQEALSQIDADIMNGESIVAEIEQIEEAFKKGTVTLEDYKAKMGELGKKAKSQGLEETANIIAKVSGRTASGKPQDLDMAGMARTAATKDTRKRARKALTDKGAKSPAVDDKVIDKYITKTKEAAKADKKFAEGKKELERNTAESSKAIKNLTNTTQQVSQTIVKTAQATMSLAYGINALSQLGNIWSDDTLSGGQKFLQTLMSLGTAIPMLMNGLTGMNAVLGVTSVLEQKAAIASQLYLAAHGQKLAILTAEQQAELATNMSKATGLTLDQAKVQVSNAVAAAKLQEAAASGTLTAASTAEQIAGLAGISTDQAEIISKKLAAGATLEEAMAEAGLTATKTGGIAASVMQIYTKGLESGARWANVVAMIAEQTAMSPLLVITLLLVAAMAALAAVIAIVVTAVNAIVNAYNADAIAAEKAEVAAKELAKAYNEAKASYEEMIAAMEEYQSARDALDSLTKGTEEYSQALKEANRQALDLINTYDKYLNSDDYHWENGELIINEDALKRAQAQKNAEVDTAYAASSMGAAHAKEMRAVSDQTNLKRSYYDGNVGTATLQALGSSMAATIIPGLGAFLAPVLSTLSYATYAVKQGEEYVYGKGVDAAMALYREGNKNIFDSQQNLTDALNEIGIKDEDLINALWENKDALQELGSKFDTAEMAGRAAAQENARTFIENSTYSNSKYAEEMTHMIGNKFYERQQELEEQYSESVKSKSGLKLAANSYFASSGIADQNGFKVEKYDKKNGVVKYSYLDDDGKRQEKEVTAQFIAAMQATTQVQLELTESCKVVSDSFAALDGQLGSTNAVLNEGMKAFLTTGDISQLTKDQYDEIAGMSNDELLTYLENIGINKDTVNAFGYEDMSAFIEALNVDGVGETWDKYQNITAHAGTENITLNAAENISGALEGIAEFFGEEVGHQILDMSALMADTLDEAAQDEFWEQLGNISDYADADQWDAFLEAMKDCEDVTDEQVEMLEEYVEISKLASRATKDLNFDSMAESIRGLRDIMDSISEGNREISDEEFAVLEAQGIDTSKFAKTIDGYRYLGESGDLVADISKGITDKFKDAEQNFANIAATAAQASQNLIDAEAELAAAREAGDRARASAELNADNQLSNTEKLSIIMSTIVNNVVSKIKAAWDQICGVMMDIYDFFATIFNKIGQGITDIWNNFLEAIENIINGVVGEVVKLLEGIPGVDIDWEAVAFDRANFEGVKTTEEVAAEEKAKKAEEDLIVATQNLADAIPDMVASIESSADYLSEAELAAGQAEAEQNYNTAQSQYDAAVATYGADSTQAEYYEQLVAYYEAQMEAYAKALDSKAWGEVVAEGIDTKEMESYIDLLEQAHPEMRQLYESTEDYEKALLQVATANKKMEKGVKSLSSNWDSWNDIMSDSEASASDIATILPDVNDALQDVLNLDTAEFALLPPDFAQKHWNLIQDVVNGVEGSVDTLRNVAGQEILMTIDGVVDPDGNIDAEFLALHEKIASFDQAQFTVGVAIDPEANAEFIAACNDIIQKAGMTAEQAQAYFASMGYDVVLKPVKQQISETVWNHVYQNLYDAQGNPAGRVIQRAWPSTFTGEVDALAIETITPNGSYGGGIGVETTAPKTSRNNATQTGGGGGGSDPKTLEKRDTTKESDTVERYREVNDAIDNVTDALTRAERATNRLWGKDKLKAMRENNAVLAEHYRLLQQNAKEAEEYAKRDAATLQDVAKDIGVSVVIDSHTGDISNIEDVENELHERLAAAETEYNRKVAEYNQKREEYSAGGFTESEMKSLEALQDAIEAYERDVLGEIEDDIAAWEDAEQRFQESVETWEDAGLEAEEVLDKMMQNNFDIWSEELELRVEINERDLELLEYYLSKTEDNVYQMAEAVALVVGSVGSNFEGGQLGAYIDNLSSFGTQYAELVERLNSTDPEYQISSAQYKEGLEQIQAGLLDNLSSIQELDKAMLNYYGDTLAMVGEEIDKYTEKMEHQSSVLEHYGNMMEILGKSQDYESMGTILQGQADVLADQVDVAKAEYDLYAQEAENKRKLYEDAIAAGDQAAAEVYKKEWEAADEAAMEAQQNMLDKTEEWAESMKAVVENKLAGLAQSLESALTGGTSFDELTTSLERAASLQEEYLTTTNQIYETNKLMRTAQQEIDKTTNTVAKQRLKDFIKETDQLQDKSKLSQYELEIQQAKYDLLLAEIALEEAQSAKSTVRLQRDAEGNFGYVYTADQDQLANAQQELEDAQNSLYNIGLEGANEYTEKYSQTMQEMYDTLTSIQEAWLNGEIATQEEYDRQMLAAQEYYYQQLEDYSSLYSVAISTDSRVIKDAWSSGFNSMMSKTNEWKEKVNQYSAEARETLVNWYAKVDEIANKTGLDNIASKVKAVTDESKALKDAVIGEDGKGGVVQALKDELTAVSNLTGGYAELRGTIQGLIADYEALMLTVNNAQNQQTEMNQQQQNGDGGNNGDGNGGGSGDSGNTGGAGGDSGGSGGGDNTTPTLTTGQDVTVKTTATHFSRDGGNGTRMRSFVPGSTYSVMEIQGEEVLIGRGGTATGWVRKSDLVGFNTGGYTGEWGPYGKLAILDEKELVLNKQDTANFLASMELLEHILEIIDLQTASAQLGGMLTSPRYADTAVETIEQNVHIEASFPAVQDRNEIEEAFNTLINRASQYANRK